MIKNSKKGILGEYKIQRIQYRRNRSRNLLKEDKESKK